MKGLVIAITFLFNTAFGNEQHENSTASPSERCRNTSLNPTEYAMTARDKLQTIYIPDRIFTNFQLNELDGSATVCFPYSQQFETCSNHWQLKRSEIRWIEGTTNFVDTVHNVTYKLGDYKVMPNDNFLVCIPDDELPLSPTLNALHHWITLTGWAMSAASMSVVLLVYCLLPRSKTDLSPTRSHVVSWLLAYVFLAAHSAVGRTTNSEFACYFVAIGRQLSVIAALCWTNVLSFELWWRCRSNSLVQIDTTTSAKSRCSRFFLQNCYGWGVAAVVFIVSVILDVSASDIRPNYSELCAVSGRVNQAFLFYGPITLCVSVNLILFVFTLVSIFRVRQYISLGSLQMQLLCMSIKLMVLMGIPWCLEVITWAIPTRPEYLFAFDLITSFQGVLLFAIYTLRQQVKLEIRKIFVTYVTYYCCFYIAKKVAITPLKHNTLSRRETTV